MALEVRLEATQRGYAISILDTGDTYYSTPQRLFWRYVRTPTDPTRDDIDRAYAVAAFVAEKLEQVLCCTEH